MLLFKWVVEAVLMPLVSLFGLAGNVFSIFVLRDRDVKLRRDFVDVLCALALFDILFLCCTFLLFSLPCWTDLYLRAAFPVLAPFLFPLTNTFMTASIYMTVAVAVNRYLEMSMEGSRFCPCRIQSGIRQAVLVFAAAAAFNFPRWFEFEFGYEYKLENTTLANGTVVSVNVSFLDVGPTELREDETYVRDYTLIANSVCVLIAPTLVMLVSTCLIIQQMIRQPAALRYTSEQERARKKRNRSITVMLIGIILLFIACHVGEVFISVYEMALYVRNSGGSEFPVWAKNVIVVNHLLIVLNSSLNFAIYCKDLVFRQTVRKVYGAIFKKKGASSSFAGGGGGGGGQRRAGNRGGGRDLDTRVTSVESKVNSIKLNHVVVSSSASNNGKAAQQQQQQQQLQVQTQQQQQQQPEKETLLLEHHGPNCNQILNEFNNCMPKNGSCPKGEVDEKSPDLATDEKTLKESDQNGSRESGRTDSKEALV